MPIKSIFFDFMGTCLDWHSSVVTALPPDIDEQQRSRFALAWRQSFFDRLKERNASGQEPEHIDYTFHQSYLDTLGDDEHSAFRSVSSTDLNSGSPLIHAWHKMPAWQDVTPALDELRKNGLELFVLANGSTRLQLDLVRSGGLQGKFDMLFSSQLLGVYKPSPAAYAKALELVDCRPEDSVMVACHAYDLRATRELGMNVVYVRRWTDDPEDDEDQLREEFSGAYLDNSFNGLLKVIEKFD